VCRFGRKEKRTDYLEDLGIDGRTRDLIAIEFTTVDCIHSVQGPLVEYYERQTEA
jgi:hypothetical protein